MLQYITLPNTPADALPYSHAVRAGDFLFISGQIAEDPYTGAPVLGPIEAQMTQVMENLKLILHHAQTDFDRVVMARIFISDFRYYATVNEIYQSYFPSDRRPSRTTVGVVGLAELGDVEIDLIAYCGA